MSRIVFSVLATACFFTVARQKFGDKKGCKRTALIEAIQEWVKKEKQKA